MMDLGGNPVNQQRGCGCGTKTTSNHCDTRRVTSISRVGDDVIITFNDCTYMSAKPDVLDGKSVCGVNVDKTLGDVVHPGTTELDTVKADRDKLKDDLARAEGAKAELEKQLATLQDKLKECEAKKPDTPKDDPNGKCTLSTIYSIGDKPVINTLVCETGDKVVGLGGEAVEGETSIQPPDSGLGITDD